MGKKVIESPSEIEYNTSIYLVAHGDDPLLVREGKHYKLNHEKISK